MMSEVDLPLTLPYTEQGTLGLIVGRLVEQVSGTLTVCSNLGLSLKVYLD